jgi:hypothetical protein
MAGRPVYLLIFLMPSPGFELWTLAGYTSLVISNLWLNLRMCVSSLFYGTTLLFMDNRERIVRTFPRNKRLLSSSYLYTKRDFDSTSV